MTLKTTKELLPCPFCGGAAHCLKVEGPYTSSFNNPDVWAVYCLSCGSRKTDYLDYEEAITAWNTRHDANRAEELKKENVDLRAKLDEYYSPAHMQAVEYSPAHMQAVEDRTIQPLRREVADLRAKLEWQPIETAPRDSRSVLVAYNNLFKEWKIYKAWWRLPYESAPDKECYWCYDGNMTLLDASVHRLGATHWMPLPEPPGALKEQEK